MTKQAKAAKSTRRAKAHPAIKAIRFTPAPPVTKEQEPNTARRAARNAANAATITKAKQPTQAKHVKGMVPGHPMIKQITGKGTTGRTIASVQSANKGHDSVAILNDGSAQPATKLLGAGIAVKAGMDWDKVRATYDAHEAKEQAALTAKPKGAAVLARGAEGEVHSRKAAADSRKAASKPEPKAAPAKGAKKGKAAEPKAAKNKQPSNGKVRTYVAGKKEDTSKPDTFRRYMLTTILKHKDTAAAKAAHAKSGKYPTHKLDFNWAAQQGYIKFTGE